MNILWLFYNCLLVRIPFLGKLYIKRIFADFIVTAANLFVLLIVLKRTRYDIPKEVLMTIILCSVDALKTSVPVYASIRRIIYIALGLG